MTLTVCQDNDFKKFRRIIPSLEKKTNVDSIVSDAGLSTSSSLSEIGALFLVSAWAGHLEMCKYLLERHGVIIDAQNSRKENALHLAAERGHFEVIKYLVSEAKKRDRGEMIIAKNTNDFMPSDFTDDVDIKTYLREHSKNLSFVDPLSTISPNGNSTFSLLKMALGNLYKQRSAEPAKGSR